MRLERLLSVKTGRRTKLISLIMLMAMCTLAMTGCTTFDNFRYTFIDEPQKNDGNTIYIGVFEPQTGSDAEIGAAEIKGIELANSIYNNVNGYNVELIKVDTQSNTKSAKTAIENLIKMEPVAIIGSCGEASSLIASEFVGVARIPTITPSAVNPLITQDNGFYFRACITDAQMGAGIAEYAYKHLASNNIAIVDIKNDSTVTAVVDGFDDKLKDMLGKKKTNPVLLRTNTTITNDSWKPLIKEIQKSGADTVFLPLTTDQMDSFLTLAEKKGLRGLTIIGTKAWGTADFVNMTKKHQSYKFAFPYDTVINEDNITTDSVTAETQRFIIEYATKYGSDDMPTQNAALGYDSYLLLMNAINYAKSTKGPAIRDALLKLTGVHGATGVFEFDEMGNTIRHVNIATIKDGKIVSDYVTKDTSHAGSIGAIE